MMSLMRRSIGFLLLAAAASVLFLAGPVSAQSGDDEPKRIAIYDDVRYRSGDSDAWLLDIAVPENFGDEMHPAIVIVHGGGWSGGSRRARPYRSMLTEYALKGYVTASIDYRLLGEADMPEMLEDVHCAVSWLRAHADEYDVDPERIGTYGHSAGAHLALMLSVPQSELSTTGDCEWGEYSSDVQAVAGGAAPTFLPDRFGDSELYSPLTYAASQTKPVLLIQGLQDPVVTPESVEEYLAALEAAGVEDVTYVPLDGNHGVAYEHQMEPSMSAISEFFARTLDNPAGD